MATPNPSIPAEDLTKCGICKETVNEPKALPCLHTFCLICLREWTASEASATSVVCPACKKPVSLPADGVEGLPGNFFVSSLMERSRTVTPMNVACVCCEEMGSKLLARCLTCDGFLCNKGVELHRTLTLLKSHQVIKLDDLRSGKVKLSSILAKQPTCDKHKGQPLWFFCETCGVLVCRDCTVVNHKSPEHAYVELDSAIKEQKNVIKQLVEESNATSQRVDDILQMTRSTRSSLDVNAKKATLDIENAVKSAVEQIQKIGQSEKDKLDKWVISAHSKVHATEESLLSQQAQVKRAQEMAKQVLQTGSDYDVASVYQQLKTSLQDVCVEPTPLESGLDGVIFKTDCSVVTSIRELGTLALGVNKVSSGIWVAKKTFGQDKASVFCYVSAITKSPGGDIAVAITDSQVHVFSSDGKYKFSLDKKSSNAKDLITAPDDGRFFVTAENQKCVTIYSPMGKFLSDFPAVSPKKVKSSAENTSLGGLAINQLNQLLVGEEKKKYISVHDLQGTNVTSIKTPVSPRYIAVTRQNNIVASSRGTNSIVHVLDINGIQLVNITAPQGLSGWLPGGVCVSLNNEICIVNDDVNDKGIHCFNSSGQYLGCIYKCLSRPEGISLADNDKILLVGVMSHGITMLTLK